jgi:hypothetical protein
MSNPTPAQQVEEQYHRASSAAKMADRFIGASNAGRSLSQLEMAEKNLKLALDSINTIRNINALKRT